MSIGKTACGLGLILLAMGAAAQTAKDAEKNLRDGDGVR